MAETPKETPTFETDDVDANRAIEQGLGVGARELAAQRDPGGVVTPDEDEESETGVSTPAEAADDEEQLSRTSDA